VLDAPAEAVDALVEAYGGSLLHAILRTMNLGVLSQRQFVELASRASWAHLIRNNHDVMRMWLGEHTPSLPIARVLAELLQPSDFAVVPLSLARHLSVNGSEKRRHAVGAALFGCNAYR